MKAIAVLGVLALAGGAGAWFFGGGAGGGVVAAAGTPTFTVQRGTLQVAIVENGTLVAKESQKVVPRFRGEGKILFLLEEGKTVQEGDVVCRVDSTSLQQQIEQQEMEVVQGEAALVTAKTELEIQAVSNAAEVEKAQVTLDFVTLEEQKYRDGDAPQEKRNLEIAIKDAATEHHRANKRHEDSLKLVEQDFIKRSELEQHAIDLEKATVKLEGAKLALQLFEEYTRPMTLRKNANAVKDAQRDLEAAQKRAKSKLNQREADVLQAEKRLKQMKQQLEKRREDVDNMTLRAPCPGILIYGDPREPWYREQIKVGGNVWSGNTLMTIPDLRVLQVKLEVHEADVNKVKVGQRTTVTMDTYPGLVLHGEVARVADIAAAGNPWSGMPNEVKRFDVEVVLRDTEGLVLKPGISAKAHIEVATLHDVVFVPLQCVFPDHGAYVCLVAGEGAPARRPVEIGLSSDAYIEIRKGLEPGERVLLYNPFVPTSGEPEQQPGDGPATAATAGGPDDTR